MEVIFIMHIQIYFDNTNPIEIIEYSNAEVCYIKHTSKRTRRSKITTFFWFGFAPGQFYPNIRVRPSVLFLLAMHVEKCIQKISNSGIWTEDADKRTAKWKKNHKQDKGLRVP